MLTISEFARLGQVSPRMLRHYGETGLLAPAQIDAHTGYRFYDVAQLSRLHRLVALRELGFSLEQIRPMKQLRKLYLSGSAVTAAGVDAFHHANPLCEVSWK